MTGGDSLCCFALVSSRRTHLTAALPPPCSAGLRPLSRVPQAAILSPDKKSDKEYTPKLADAIRTPTLDDALAPDAGLPPVGDLFSAVPQLPAYLQANVGARGAPQAAPQLPDWNSKRPFLTGRFLLDGAVEQQQRQQGSSGGGKAGSGGSGATGAAATAAQVLESYPPSVQESLREYPPGPGLAASSSYMLPLLC